MTGNSKKCVLSASRGFANLLYIALLICLSLLSASEHPFTIFRRSHIKEPETMMPHLSDEWEVGLTYSMYADTGNVCEHLKRVFSTDSDFRTSADGKRQRGDVLTYALSYKHRFPVSAPRRTMSSHAIESLAQSLVRIATKEGASHVRLWIDQQFEKCLSRERHLEESWIRFGMQAYFTYPVLYIDTKQSGWDLEGCVKRGWVTLEHCAGIGGKGLYLTEPFNTGVVGGRPNLWGLCTRPRIDNVEKLGIVSTGNGNRDDAQTGAFNTACLFVQGVVRRGLESFTDWRDFPAIKGWANSTFGSICPSRILSRGMAGTLSCDWNSIASGALCLTPATWMPHYTHNQGTDLMRDGVLRNLCWNVFLAKPRGNEGSRVYAVGVANVTRSSKLVFLMLKFVDNAYNKYDRVEMSKRFFIEEDTLLADAIRTSNIGEGFFADHLVIRSTGRTPKRHLHSCRSGEEPWIDSSSSMS